jgi:hypothetical protein
MYFQPVNHRSAMNFSFGVQMAASAIALGHDFKPQTVPALVSRGWRFDVTDKDLSAEMQSRGMSDEEMADEVLAIEIEGWKMLLEQLSNQP